MANVPSRYRMVERAYRNIQTHWILTGTATLRTSNVGANFLDVPKISEETKEGNSEDSAHVHRPPQTQL